MLRLGISASTCCVRTEPQEVESIFKSRNFATDNLVLSNRDVGFQLQDRVFESKQSGLSIHGVYSSDSRLPYKLGKDNSKIETSCLFSNQHRSQEKICQGCTGKGQFSFDSSK